MKDICKRKFWRKLYYCSFSCSQNCLKMNFQMEPTISLDLNSINSISINFMSESEIRIVARFYKFNDRWTSSIRSTIARLANSQPTTKIIKRHTRNKSWEATKLHPTGFVAFITQLRNYSTWFETCHPWNRSQPSEQCPDSVSTLVPGRPDTPRASRLMFQRMRAVIRGHNHRRRLIVSHNDRCCSIPTLLTTPQGFPSC